MFLTSIEAKQRGMATRITEIRRLLKQTQPPAIEVLATACGIRIPHEIRDRLEEVRSRHGLRSLKETVYLTMTLGLVTLERLEPERRGRAGGGSYSLSPSARVLSDDEISRLRSEGWNAPRVLPVAAE